MVTKAEKIFFAVVILFLIGLPFFWRDLRDLLVGDEKTKAVATQVEKGTKKEKGGKKQKSDNDNEQFIPEAVTILKKWDLPSELTEVSSIVYLDPKRFVCVQDEEGSLFIFNTETETIERKIPFAGKGDFEGLSLAESTAYVLRSDGVIYEIAEYNSNHPKVKQYTTHLTAENDCEGLTWDKKQNRLLVTVKKTESKNNTPIYSFDLASKKMAVQPALTIDYSHPVFEGSGKKKDRNIRPSAIGIHPSTGDIYVLEGTNPKLLIMDKESTPRKLMLLDKTEFAQPEGLTFSPSGNLFVSNEGGKGNGNILHVATK